LELAQCLPGRLGLLDRGGSRVGAAHSYIHRDQPCGAGCRNRCSRATGNAPGRGLWGPLLRRDGFM